MKFGWAHTTLSFVLLTTGLIYAQPTTLAVAAAQTEKQQPKSASKTGASLTGCIDEQDGHYVLVDDRTLTPIASLEADGFPQEAFAKHLGHRVTVRGILNPGAARPVFKVRSVDKISDTCAPQQ
jgi:hypothetical protein